MNWAGNPWAVLGLPPGADRDAIRRAYARKLKGVNPEDDPDGFMALRAAHDAALNQLKWRQQWPTDAEPDAADADAEDTAVPEAAPVSPIPAPVAATPAPPPPVAADTPPPEIDPAERQWQAERAAERADLQARQQALIAAIDDDAPQSEQHRAFDQLLAAPALIDITARDWIERWVASAIAARLPASDPLVVHAIESFGWADLPLGQRDPDIERLLRRREEGEFVANIARRHTPLHIGYKALSSPPGPGWWRHFTALFSAEPAQTRQILGLVDGPLPGMADWLNADAMAWWRNYHAVPRLRLWMILTMIPLASVLLVGSLEGSGWPEPARLAFSLLVWASPWGLLWLLRRRTVWEQDWNRPEWHYSGWPLAGLALPLLAALWPPLPALTPLYLLPLGATLGWALLAIDRLQPAGWRDLAPGLVRALPPWLFLALMVGGAPVSDGLGPVRAMAVFGCAVLWWQAGDQLGWSARQWLGRRSDRAGGPLAPWLLQGAGLLVALVALGLGLASAALVGRALALLPLALLATLAALRIAQGWAQAGPAALLLVLGLVLVELLSQLDPAMGGASAAVTGLASLTWLIDPRSGWPRPGVIFVLLFGLSFFWPRLRAAMGNLPNRAIAAVGIAAVALVIIALVVSGGGGDRRAGGADPAVPQAIGVAQDWIDAGPVLRDLPPGRYDFAVDLTVNPEGRVARCALRKPTGAVNLDVLICPQLAARGRFKPVLDAAGTPMAVTFRYESAWNWRVPAGTAAASEPPASGPAATGAGGDLYRVAQPIGDRADWYDLPPEALQARPGRHAVEARLVIAPDGRIVSCRVEQPSGIAAVDAGLCAQVQAKGRYTPARDIRGRLLPAVERYGLEWTVRPRTPPPPVICPPAAAGGPMVAEPCMPDRWFYDGSYPRAALAAGHSGVVAYLLNVGRDGRIESCRIERSSGHATLDAGTCALLKARARFVPARDVDGSPMPWDYRGSIRWQLDPP